MNTILMPQNSTTLTNISKESSYRTWYSELMTMPPPTYPALLWMSWSWPERGCPILHAILISCVPLTFISPNFYIIVSLQLSHFHETTCTEIHLRDDVHMTSALRGREGVSQILTRGREVAWNWYWQGGGRGSKIPKFYQTSYVHAPLSCRL